MATPSESPSKMEIPMRKLRRSIVAVACGAALFTAGVALADNPGHPNNGQGTTATGALVTTKTVSTSTSTLQSQAKGYGLYFQWARKKDAAGPKGQPFLT